MTLEHYENLSSDDTDEQIAGMQGLIDSGAAWKLEGSVGRAAMAALESGACHLPAVPHTDYYGNRVPAYFMVEPGTKGSIQCWQEYHQTDAMPAGLDWEADEAAWKAS